LQGEYINLHPESHCRAGLSRFQPNLAYLIEADQLTKELAGTRA